jgi:hypothetical protein
VRVRGSGRNSQINFAAPANDSDYFAAVRAAALLAAPLALNFGIELCRTIIRFSFMVIASAFFHMMAWNRC